MLFLMRIGVVVIHIFLLGGSDEVLLRIAICGVYYEGENGKKNLRNFPYIFFLLFISSLYNLASLELRENLLTYLPE